MSDVLSSRRESWPVTNLMQRSHAASPALWRSMLAMLVLAFVFTVLLRIDQRLLAGVNVWVKPAKFALSIGLQFATVAWVMSLLPSAERRGRRFAPALLLWSGWLELAYITFRAARGEASHFNQATPVAAIAYALMGVGAVCMVAASFRVGQVLWRHRKSSLLVEAAALGLMLGSILGGLSGVYLGNQTGHFTSPATSTIGLFGWSSSGGDWRVAHFAGLHAAQVLPLAVHIWPRRGTIYIAAALISALSIAVFLQAWFDMPLFRG